MDIENYISSGILEAYVLDTLSQKERAEVETMLEKHPELRQELHTIEENLEVIAMETAIAPPADLKNSILGQIEEKKVEESVQSETKVVPMEPKKPFAWNYVAAASITLALATSYLAYDYHNRWKTTEEAYGQLQASNQRMAEQYNQVNNRLDQLVTDIDVISNADFNRVNMAAVNEGESFSASVYWNSKTQEAYLNIQDLKELSSNQQYQLWAIVGGNPVDMGVFDSNQEGLLKMKSVGNASTFAVTIEPRGGSVNPTLEAMQVAGNV